MTSALICICQEGVDEICTPSLFFFKNAAHKMASASCFIPNKMCAARVAHRFGVIVPVSALYIRQGRPAQHSGMTPGITIDPMKIYLRLLCLIMYFKSHNSKKKGGNEVIARALTERVPFTCSCGYELFIKALGTMGGRRVRGSIGDWHGNDSVWTRLKTGAL